MTISKEEWEMKVWREEGRHVDNWDEEERKCWAEKGEHLDVDDE